VVSVSENVLVVAVAFIQRQSAVSKWLLLLFNENEANSGHLGVQFRIIF